MGPVDKAAARLPHSADLDGSLQRDLPPLPHGVDHGAWETLTAVVAARHGDGEAADHATGTKSTTGPYRPARQPDGSSRRSRRLSQGVGENGRSIRRSRFRAKLRTNDPMAITHLILDDHQEQRRLFSILEQLDRTDTKSLTAMWKRLAAFLEVHAEAEEQIFYPVLLRL